MTDLNTCDDLELADRLRNTSADKLTEWEQGFRTSVLNSLKKYASWTFRQRATVRKILNRIELEPEMAKLNDLSGIYGLFGTARGHLKHPKLTFSLDFGTVRLHVAGERSRYSGQIMVTDGGGYYSGIYYGRIDADGQFYPSDAVKPDLLNFLNAFSEDPAGMASQYGKESGNCCFCSRKLTDERSLDVGYGPVCATKWELPWG